MTIRRNLNALRPDMSAQRPPGAVALSVMLLVLVIVLADVYGSAQRAPGLGSWQGGALFVLFGWALGSSVMIPLALLRRRVLDSMADAAPASRALFGMGEAFAFFLIAIIGQDPRAAGNARVWMLVGACAGWAVPSGLWAWLKHDTRLRHAPSVACVFAIGAAVYMLHPVGWNAGEWLRVALDMVLVLAGVELLSPWLARVSRPNVAIAAAASALLLLMASEVLLQNRDARAALHRRSSHVRSWSYVVETAFDFDRDGRVNLFGAGQESSADEARAAPAPVPAPVARAHGTAVGSDVLILSIDSLRWDTLTELSPLRTAIGPHASFLRATSPSSATKQSLSATIRGVDSHRLRLERAKGARGEILWRDPLPTLGHFLHRAGYRAVTLPTNHMMDPRNGIAPGFQTIWLANYDARSTEPLRPPTASRSYVPTKLVTPLMLNVARDTPGPLCVWIHAMEPHAGYYWGDGKVGPHGPWAHRQAVHDLSEHLAGFVREFTSLRERPTIIAVFGDHGEEFGEHGGQTHGSTTYAEQTRVAFLLAGPGVAQAEYTDPVSTASLPATLLDLLGLPPPPQLSQRSLLPAMEGTAPWPTVVVSEIKASGNRFWRSFLAGRFHLVTDPVHDIAELFDIDTDPEEQVDLTRTKPAELRRMRGLADEWRRSQRPSVSKTLH